MHRRDLLSGAAVSAAVAALPAGTIRARAQASSGTITFGQSTSILTLDPAHGAFTGYPGGYEAALVLFDRLLDFDDDMRIVPQLAESYEMSQDLKSCTLKLRPNVTFHDGTPCDAAAVKLNIERMMDKERNTTNRPLWDPIAGVETPDATTVVIRTSRPFAQLPNTLAHGSGAIVSPAALAKHGEASFAQNPVGAGPYMLEGFSPGQELALKAFDGYWGGKPGAGRIVFKFIAEPATRINALSTGAVDVIDSVPVQLVQQISQSPNADIIRRPGLRPIGLAFNLTRPPLADQKVRQALNLAVPVATIAEKVFFGFAKAPDSPLAFDTIGHKTVGESVFDQEKAKALLAEAGYAPGSDGAKLSLALYAPEGLFPGDIAVAEIVAASLKQVGVDAAITKIEKGAYWDHLRQDKANLKWDLAMFGFNPSNASGAYHMASLFRSNADDDAKPEVWNIGRYKNPRVDELLVTADSAPGESERMEALGEAQRLVWEDAPYLWLQINENVTAVRQGVTGVEVLPIVFTSLRNAES
ncbi:glutathione ABC transporter substrate-binding protein [Mesorhizobium sp. L-8-10]|uniref:ABC transporter substrate-binding protein n=1 Tax=Mesorhizobium sp. L-8-10 TaxID=2744523 RepID=UPI001925426E|nr:ABC transporter substrate-binding protein [Mesorhizobium sp. L-8-10]BCH35865.1 glutathione ABC transporter substrate-binding protein [Mesorhizobium sp. L-8-10]